MKRVYPEQLTAQLREGLRSSYLLCGNDPLLLQESQDHICQVARQQEFSEKFSFQIDQHTDWDAIFAIPQELSLFATRQILVLTLPDNGPNSACGESLLKLISLLHADILFILRCHKLTKAQENMAWYKALQESVILVTCITPEHTHLPRWVSQRARQQGLQLDDAANQLLCYCYEGNLLALSQALERLQLLYPDGKLTLPRVETAVNAAAHFTPYHWVDALLAGKSKRALHILQQLQLEGCETTILLRTVQRELLLLLRLQRGQSQIALRTLFDQHKVWQNRRPLLTQALQTLSAERLQQAINLLASIEIMVKQDFTQQMWPHLESLSLLLCNKSLPPEFFDVR